MTDKTRRIVKMKKLFFVAIGLMLIFSFTSAKAQKEKYHSLFIYNFSKYVKWPDDQQSGDFVIGVLGYSDIIKTLQSMAVNKKVNGSKIVIKQFNSVFDIKGCHILYVASSESGKMSQVISNTLDLPILIVSDKPGMAKKGAVINFVEREGKIKFELNQNYAESRGLKVSGSLISLAILV